jgi:hypothetical protein
LVREARDLAAGHQAPPAGLFATLLDAFAAGEGALSGALDAAPERADINRPMALRRLAFMGSLVKPDYRAGYRR